MFAVATMFRGTGSRNGKDPRVRTTRRAPGAAGVLGCAGRADSNRVSLIRAYFALFRTGTFLPNAVASAIW